MSVVIDDQKSPRLDIHLWTLRDLTDPTNDLGRMFRENEMAMMRGWDLPSVGSGEQSENIIETVVTTGRRIDESQDAGTSTVDGKKEKDPMCLQGNSRGSYLANVIENFSDTNSSMPGLLAPVGVSFITAGATSQAWLGSPSATFGRWAFTGFSSLRVGAAAFTTLESGIIVGASSTLNFAFAGLSFETGALAGSMISSIPTGSGNTIRDSLADTLFDNLGPEILPDELKCGW